MVDRIGPRPRSRPDDTLDPHVHVLPPVRSRPRRRSRSRCAPSAGSRPARSRPRSSSPRRRWPSASAGRRRRSRRPTSRSRSRPPRTRGERLRSVLHVLYLLFNEGYASSSGPDLARTDLSDEAIRLARGVHGGAAGRSRGRRSARAHAAHRRAPSCAHRTRTASSSRSRSRTARAGTATLHRRGRRAASPPRCSRASVGEYQVQAAIAAVHDQAAALRRHELVRDRAALRRASNG